MNRYSDIQKKTTLKGKQYYREAFITSIPEREGDVYFITEAGDRLDLIAYEFYNDSSFYWILAAANPVITRRDSYMVEAGKQFRVPIDPQNIIQQYKQFNINR